MPVKSKIQGVIEVRTAENETVRYKQYYNRPERKAIFEMFTKEISRLSNSGFYYIVATPKTDS